MGYIVDLTVILCDIFRSAAGDTKLKHLAESILEDFKTRRRSQIHEGIRRFVEAIYPMQTAPDNAREEDMFLGKVGDLIMQNCSPPQVSVPY